MRKLYVPIMMDPEHNVDVYADDFKKLGVDHLFLSEGNRLVHLAGEEYAAAIEVEAVCTPKTLGRIKEYVTAGWSPKKEPWED